MKLHIIAAFKEYLSKQTTLDISGFADRCIIVLGVQTSLTEGREGRNVFVESLLHSLFTGDDNSITNLVRDESVVQQLMKELDFLGETVFKGFLDASEIQDIKDHLVSITC